jgi:hypothetical protein
MRAKRFVFCLLVLEIWTDLQYPFARRGSGATGLLAWLAWTKVVEEQGLSPR